MSELDYTTGTYSIIYTLFPTVSSSRGLQINAVGFNPVDNKTYGMLKYKINTTAHSFFVRFDVFSIEYLGKMDLSYSGMVDRDGDFYFFSDSSKTFKKIKDAQLVTGVTTQANNHYISASQLSSSCAPDLGATVATRADLGLSSVAIPLDIVQLCQHRGGRAARLHCGLQQLAKSYCHLRQFHGYGAWALDATYNGNTTSIPAFTAGAHWNYQNTVFVSITMQTVFLKSSPPPSTLWPKRSRCAASGAPTRPAATTASTATRPTLFTTCGDKNGPAQTPNPNPVTTAECGAGSSTLTLLRVPCA